jgi:hypothetical protein
MTSIIMVLMIFIMATIITIIIAATIPRGGRGHQRDHIERRWSRS